MLAEDVVPGEGPSDVLPNGIGSTYHSVSALGSSTGTLTGMSITTDSELV